MKINFGSLWIFVVFSNIYCLGKDRNYLSGLLGSVGSLLGGTPHVEDKEKVSAPPSEDLQAASTESNNNLLYHDIAKDIRLFLGNKINSETTSSGLTQQITNIILAKYPQAPKHRILHIKNYILRILHENNFDGKDFNASRDILLQKIPSYVENCLKKCIAWNTNKYHVPNGTLKVDFPSLKQKILILLRQNIDSQGVLSVKNEDLAEKVSDSILVPEVGLSPLLKRHDLVVYINRLIGNAQQKRVPININHLQKNITNYIKMKIANEADQMEEVDEPEEVDESEGVDEPEKVEEPEKVDEPEEADEDNSDYHYYYYYDDLTVEWEDITGTIDENGKKTLTNREIKTVSS